MAPIAAPFAAPLALGWEFCWVCVAAGGVWAGGVCAGGVCAGGGCAAVCARAAGITAPESAIRRDITLAECFIMASFLVPPDPPCGFAWGHLPTTIGDRLRCSVVAFYDVKALAPYPQRLQRHDRLSVADSLVKLRPRVSTVIKLYGSTVECTEERPHQKAREAMGA
jgi:hypothetical protein